MNIYSYNFLLFATFGLLDSVYNQQVNEESIKKLEAEKNKLQKDIEAAIDDGFSALRQEGGNVDSGAGAEERYLAALKLHVQRATGGKPAGNDTSHGPADNSSAAKPTQFNIPGEITIANKTTNAKNLRRYDFNKKKKRGPNDLDEIFIYKEKSDIEPEKAKVMDENRFKMEKKLFEWMIKREEEKKQLKEYLEKKRAHLLEVVTEKCPRFGYGAKTTRKMSRRRASLDEVDAYRMAQRNKPKYPCCRKCCKKSYLGCL